MTRSPASPLRFRLATPADDASLRRILRETPIPGSVTVTMEREPSFFLGATIEGDLHQTIVCGDVARETVAGLASRSAYDAFVQGTPGRLGYLSQLRAGPSYRGLPRVLVRGFRFIHELHGDGAAPFYITTLIDGNEPARRILEKTLDGKAEYRRRDLIRTFAIPLWRRRGARPPAGIALRRGRAADLGDIAALLQRVYADLQFAPRWTADDLHSPERTRGLGPSDFLVAEGGGRLVGCLALWGQMAFKQNVIRGYGGALGWTRPILNGAARLVRAPQLPAVGQALPGVFVSHVAVVDHDAQVYAALLRQALADLSTSGAAFATVGFAAGHPLATVTARLARHIEYRAHLYTAHFSDGAAAVEGLDGRVAHVEIATL